MRIIMVGILFLLIVQGCTFFNRKPVVQIRIVEVKVPVQVKATPPPELLVPLYPEIPVFILPSDDSATSCLSDVGQDRQKRLIILLTDHLRAWRLWGRE